MPERARLYQLMSANLVASEASAYAAMPPHADEFTSDKEPLAWETEGWALAEIKAQLDKLATSEKAEVAVMAELELLDPE